MANMVKKLFRSRTNRMIFGICGGIGDYLGADPTVVRIVAVLLAFFSFGTAALAYLVCALIIPERN